MQNYQSLDDAPCDSLVVVRLQGWPSFEFLGVLRKEGWDIYPMGEDTKRLSLFMPWPVMDWRPLYPNEASETDTGFEDSA